ncbi:MAG: hypothetical protein IJT50_15715 [Lentisphaeria bacterium]|nr:hypothetical protein [Lentisphaeria bacterium]
MKTFLAAAIFCAVLCSGAEVNLIPNPAGADNFKGWYRVPGSGVTAADGVITVTANPDPKVNPFQKAQCALKLKSEEIQGKKFEISFKYRTEKLDGSVQVTVREAFGSRGNYHGKILKRWDVSKDWKEARHTFTVRKDASGLAVYIAGRYMKAGEKVEIKDLKVVAK